MADNKASGKGCGKCPACKMRARLEEAGIPIDESGVALASMNTEAGKRVFVAAVKDNMESGNISPNRVVEILIMLKAVGPSPALLTELLGTGRGVIVPGDENGPFSDNPFTDFSTGGPEIFPPVASYNDGGVLNKTEAVAGQYAFSSGVSRKPRSEFQD